MKSERQEAKVKHPALLWDKGQILGKRATSKAESENAISKIRIRDLEGSATRRRRALLPLDQHRSAAAAAGQMEGGDPSAKNVGGDLIFVVPLSSAGWNLNHHHWGRRKEFFSERIGPSFAVGEYVHGSSAQFSTFSPPASVCSVAWAWCPGSSASSCPSCCSR